MEKGQPPVPMEIMMEIISCRLLQCLRCLALCNMEAVYTSAFFQPSPLSACVLASIPLLSPSPSCLECLVRNKE